MASKTIVAAAAAVLTFSAAVSAEAATLVAQYTFANAGDLGNDSTSYGNDATTLVGVSQVAGPTAGSFAGAFDGNSRFYINGGLDGFTGQPGFSFAAWVYVDGRNGGFNGVISQDFGGCCTNRLLLAGGTTPYINTGAHNDFQFGQSFATGNWYRMVLTAENSGGGTSARMYVNGVEITGSPHAYPHVLPNLTGVNTYLGTGEGGGSYPLYGALSDVRIYQGALTAEEVANLDVPNTGVPEPAAWALMLLGFGGLGATLRRRRAFAAA